MNKITELHFDCTDGATPAKILDQLEQMAGIEKSENQVLKTEEKHHHEAHSLKEILDYFENSEFSETAKKDAAGIFEILTEAECQIHSEGRDEIHFHEIGRKENLQRILKITSIIEKTGAEEFTSTALNLGFGTIECSHGTLEIPAPATKLIIEGMETYTDEKGGELTTPTGAAIIKYYTQIRK